MSELRKTHYRVLHADRRQSVMDGDAIEAAIRAAKIGPADKIALGDGAFRPYWDFPRLAPLAPASVRAEPARSAATVPPPAGSRTPQTTAENSSLGARSHTPSPPVAATRPSRPHAPVPPVETGRPASSAADVAPVPRDPVAQAVQMASERLRRDDVMSRLDDARRRLDARTGSGAWTPLGVTPPAPARETPAQPAAGTPPPASARASGASPAVRTRTGSASSDHNRIDPAPAAQARVSVRSAQRTANSGAAPTTRDPSGPAVAGLDAVVAAIEETERHAPLLERKYGGTGRIGSTDDRIDVNDTLEDALAEALSDGPRPTTLLQMPKRSEAGKAVFALLLLALAAFLVWRSLQG